MEDTHLTLQEQQQLRDALDDAPLDLKQHFCRCWPSVKQLLEWLSGRLSGVLKWVLTILIAVGDGVFKALDCDQKTAV